MGDPCTLIWCTLIRLFWSRAALEAELLVLRHQLNVLRTRRPDHHQLVRREPGLHTEDQRQPRSMSASGRSGRNADIRLTAGFDPKETWIARTFRSAN